ncbi:hypothetical protein [Massilia sp. IC2-476]|uniref:hypothetical protein n=1 Tax=Massilia sp. IC2-476 TaxID=2887199 RepID=UPI001D10E3BE|nr:hypothetical protein [Massilia sp. IC2-476]MCC2973317.1 hypothetical protein [Massilia sp. IC2-476]
MKMRIALLALACVLMQACGIGANTPRIEQSIYRPAPPWIGLKQGFYVREHERPLLPSIASASDSIATFLLDLHHPDKKTLGSIRQVLDESRPLLRLPPHASGRRERYIAILLYCWQSEGENQLSFLVEWADVTMARYTDSYVFVRRGASWYFEGHGNIAPWHWIQVQRYFQRTCPA